MKRVHKSASRGGVNILVPLSTILSKFPT